MSNREPVLKTFQPSIDDQPTLPDHSLGTRGVIEDDYLNAQLEKDSQTEKKFHSERKLHEQTSWNNFQHAASSVAQLYKDNAHGKDEQWFSFQNAAEHTTVLYRESLEGFKVYGDISAQYGYSRRNKEIIHWLKRKRKNNIKRDDLVKYLCGRTSPPYKKNLPLRHHGQLESDNQMQTFREAVCLQGLHNKMSGINFEGGQGSPRQVQQQDLSAFIHDEYKSNQSRKRSASMSGPITGQTSPKRKR